jgi:hypothetical protein
LQHITSAEHKNLSDLAMFKYPKCQKSCMAKNQVENKKGKGGLFIPAGLFLGMGFGFLFGNVTVGIFLGLGVGFAAFAVVLLMRK